MYDVEGDCVDHGQTGRADGYGQSWVYNESGRRVLRLAHRVVYEMYHGYHPTVVMHLCDNPRCINIDHLAPGTHAKNVADKVSKGRQARSLPGARCFTPDQVTEIRARSAKHAPYGREHSPAAIARDFGVAPTTIRQIIQWRSYYA